MQLVLVEPPTARCRSCSAATPSRSASTTGTIGVDTQSFSGGAGDFRFDRLFTSSNPLTANDATPRQRAGQHAARLSLGRSGQPEHGRRCRARSMPSCTTTAATSQDDCRVEPEVHVELRRAPRARGRPARREQRLHRGVRPHAEPRRRARQRDQPARPASRFAAAWSMPA